MIKREMVNKFRPELKANVHMYAWARPYNNPEIKDIYTGLGKQWEISPLFIHPIADTMIKLTGYRKKDYILAELKTGTKHIPGKTVWHHVWEEKSGEYRIQLVDFEIHKKSCPHAGGCKLWLLKNNKGKYLKYNNKTTSYTDYQVDYVFRKDEGYKYGSGYVSKRCQSKANRKGIKIYGMDAYGNIFFKSAEGKLYLWDHEANSLNSCK